MKLRIVSGSFGGRRLLVPKRAESFRPTLERTRESVINKIRHRLVGARACDLCAGSGAVGFEMLSAGALSVEFVEQNKARAELIAEAAEKFGCADRTAVRAQNVAQFLKRASTTYDIIYFDPPYDNRDLYRLVPEILQRLTDRGVLIVECRKGDTVEGTSPDEIREMGGTTVAFYHREDIASGS